MVKLVPGLFRLQNLLKKLRFITRSHEVLSFDFLICSMFYFRLPLANYDTL